jgi:hypothetical protein
VVGIIAAIAAGLSGLARLLAEIRNWRKSRTHRKAFVGDRYTDYIGTRHRYVGHRRKR